MHCALIWNPASGRGRHGREEQVAQVANLLRRRGHSVEVVCTSGPGSAGEQARNLVRQGAEIVFACGGDGTVHEVAQGLVSESGDPSASLGILPCGSANALARNLGLPLDPQTAALAQIEGSPRTVPVGKITWSGGSRYFVLMAGVGPDGALVDSLLARHKSDIGRFAYYLHAARLFLTRRFASFEVEARSASGATTAERAVGAMAVRIRDLGGLFSGLAGNSASIDDRHLRLILVRPPAFLSLPLWFFSAWLRIERFNPFLERIDADRCVFRPCSAIPPHLEADGEWLGRIPAEFTLLPNALRLCLPRFNLP